MLRKLLAIFIVAYWSESFAEPCNSLESMQWLIGEWTADNGKQITLESWKKASTQTFEGSGKTKSKHEGKILSMESLRIVEMSGEIFYLAKVEHNDFPVPFKLSSCAPGTAIFENSAHDFPKKIDYRLSSNNELTVTVSDGNDKGFKISFNKQNDS